MTLAQGYVLEGKYVITRQIAEGGMSAVYLGENRRIGKAVAVKVLHPAMATLPDVVERFEREARILSRIRSTHVADVYDFGELPTGEHFMVMEYLEGESLATLLEREHTLPARALSSIAVQILSALSAAHRAGVIHRDLKPENIIVTTRGAETLVKVVDFGISKCAGIGTDALRKTAADALMGTPLYMSPEQARGNTAAVDERTDIYALGVILYEATAGELPLTGDNVQDVLYRIAVEEPVPLESRIPSVDTALAAIVRRAMAKSSEDRFASAADMLQAVEDWRALHVSSSLVPSDPAGSGAHSTAPVILPTASSSTARTVATPLAASSNVEVSAPEELPAAPVARPRARLGRAAKALALVAVVAAVAASIHGLQRAPADHASDVAGSMPAVASPTLASAAIVTAASAETLAPAAPVAVPVLGGAAAPVPRAALAGSAGGRAHRPASVLDAGKPVVAAPAPAVVTSAETSVAADVHPATRAAAPVPSSVRRAYRASFE